MYCQNKNEKFAPCRRNTAVLKCRAGFTLVELMVTLVILALLGSIVTMSVRGYLLRSKQNIAKVEIGRIVQAIEAFYATFDRYPTNDEGLEVLVSKSDEFPEGLLAFHPQDPWGSNYDYRCPGENDPFEVVSFGADKREGGAGANRDISSTELVRQRKRN